MATKIIFFGTSEFAVPALAALAKAEYEIAAVITQPDKPAGRKQEPLPSPVKQAALKLGLKVFQPDRLTSPNSLPLVGRAREGVELFILTSYGQLIPKSLLDLPKFGTLNLHPSLLPKYRGPSPIHAAILNSDELTGVTLMKLDEQLDHGPIVATRNLKISKLYYRDLHDHLANLGAKLLIATLPDYLAGKINPKAQDHDKATFTQKITKEMARINWQKSAEEINRLVRAYSTWPVAWTTLGGKRLKIYKVKVATSPHPSPSSERVPKAGEVQVGGNNQIYVKTGGRQLEILSIQLEGSKILTAADFVRGHPSLNGKILV